MHFAFSSLLQRSVDLPPHALGESRTQGLFREGWGSPCRCLRNNSQKMSCILLILNLERRYPDLIFPNAIDVSFWSGPGGKLLKVPLIPYCALWLWGHQVSKLTVSDRDCCDETLVCWVASLTIEIKSSMIGVSHSLLNMYSSQQ